jgi:DNA adenine methylase
MSFPETKYVGSKRALVPYILDHIAPLKPRTVLDAFSGSACVSYALKQQGYEVHTNDFLRFAFHVAKATVENNGTLLEKGDVSKLLKPNKKANTFIQDTFRGLYFDDVENAFLDNISANIPRIKSPLKRSLALAAICRAAMKKRPRGLFTFTGRKGWDGRKDLQLGMEEQFLIAVSQFNSAVFSNGQRNKAYCADVFDVDPGKYDLVYIDTPYVSPFSDCDYTRRYHFLEGLCTYWKGLQILPNTSTKKFRSYKTDFSTKSKAVDAFSRLFHHFAESILIVSYSSTGIPDKQEMLRLLRSVKRSVNVYEKSHTYSHGNHNHKIGNNNNTVYEYLYVAR